MQLIANELQDFRTQIEDDYQLGGHRRWQEQEIISGLLETLVKVGDFFLATACSNASTRIQVEELGNNVFGTIEEMRSRLTMLGYSDLLSKMEQYRSSTLTPQRSYDSRPDEDEDSPTALIRSLQDD